MNFCFIIIIQNNNNINIKFYLKTIMQIYIKFAFEFNLDFYIWLLSKLILLLSVLFR